MSKIRIIACLLVLNALLPAFIACGQEKEGHLNYNPFQFNNASRENHKKTEKTTLTSLTLPFFEDFTGYTGYPDPSKWLDYEVYINNEMCVSPLERGVATFDGLNQFGIPYDSFSNVNFRYADSLTSWPINLGLNLVNPGDSIYFSFFYQAQGNGYYPLTGDSLMLYFKDEYGEFIQVWAIPGPDSNSVAGFQQVMIPITDSIYFDSSFQFRFVNIAALYWADADWNVDYIRLDSNRNINDTAVNDIGFSSDPTFLLNDYTSMPYRQFLANPAAETATQFYDSIHNNYNLIQGITPYYQATASSGATLYPPTASGPYLVPNNAIMGLSFPTYTTTITSPGLDAKVVFENKYYIQSLGPADPPGNDTIVRDQVFDNYLAYDDGSAEKSYYLNLFPPDAGEIAIEYHLNQPDTLQGMAIYFGRQVPFDSYKGFSIMVWSAIAGVNGATADNLLYEQDLYSPGYADTINHFWYYNFDTPLPLPAGTFFAGTLQPAEGSSDSLYFGLDVNRIGDNHAFYNVIGTWMPSQISGAIMMRPLLGQPVQPTAVTNVQDEYGKWSVVPNPAKDKLEFVFEGGGQATFQITDITGAAILRGNVSKNTTVDITSLVPGMYFVSLYGNGFSLAPKKVIKL